MSSLKSFLAIPRTSLVELTLHDYLRSSPPLPTRVLSFVKIMRLFSFPLLLCVGLETGSSILFHIFLSLSSFLLLVIFVGELYQACLLIQLLIKPSYWLCPHPPSRASTFIRIPRIDGLNSDSFYLFVELPFHKNQKVLRPTLLSHSHTPKP